MTFGEKIKAARKEANLTQKELAVLSGISLRTIINYEHDEKKPRKRSTYTTLAIVLHVDETALMDENEEFILDATERYGDRGRQQAIKLTQEVAGLYAGGTLEEEDMDAMMKAIQDAYWVAKERNRKFVPKKYQTDTAEKEEPLD